MLRVTAPVYGSILYRRSGAAGPYPLAPPAKANNSTEKLPEAMLPMPATAVGEIYDIAVGVTPPSATGIA